MKHLSWIGWALAVLLWPLTLQGAEKKASCPTAECPITAPTPAKTAAKTLKKAQQQKKAPKKAPTPANPADCQTAECLKALGITGNVQVLCVGNCTINPPTAPPKPEPVAPLAPPRPPAQAEPEKVCCDKGFL